MDCVSHDFLHQIAVKAKWDGTYTVAWPILWKSISKDGSFEDLPGTSPIKKLQAWAQGEGLLMDYDMQFEGYISEIRSVTFSNPTHAVAKTNAR